MILLFPSSFFDKKIVDEDLEKEYVAARETALWDLVLFSYEDWFCNGKLTLTHTPESETEAVYRGWMMKPEQYGQFWHELAQRNIRLKTTPEMYNRMHIFPNVYPLVAADSVRIRTFPLHAHIDVAELKECFPRFMVKDFVKSVKGTDFPVFFDRTVTQSEFDDCMERFYRYRADLLTGGICIKEYVSLRRYHGRTNEHRVFYAAGSILSIERNSGQALFCPPPPSDLVNRYASLPSCFYTMDYGELEDGRWIIIEAGDGSVSGLSDFQNYSAFYRGLFQGLSRD